MTGSQDMQSWRYAWFLSVCVVTSRKPYWGGRLSTVDPLNSLGCFV